MEGSLSCHTIMNRRDLGSHTLSQRFAYYDKSGVLLTYTHPNPRENLIKEEDSTPTTLGHPPPLPLDWPMHLQNQKRGVSYVYIQLLNTALKNVRSEEVILT